MLPDFPREYGEYWNPAKEWDADTVEEIADVLSDLKSPDFMPVAEPEGVSAPPVIETSCCGRHGCWPAWSAFIPAVRDNVKLAEAILESYADVPDFDSREQRWTVAKPN